MAGAVYITKSHAICVPLTCEAIASGIYEIVMLEMSVVAFVVFVVFVVLVVFVNTMYKLSSPCMNWRYCWCSCVHVVARTYFKLCGYCLFLLNCKYATVFNKVSAGELPGCIPPSFSHDHDNLL